MQHDELAAWLRLTTTPGVGRTSARRLLAAFGLPQAVFAQDLDAWRACIGGAPAQALARPPEGLPALLAQTWDWLHPGGSAAPEDDARAIVTLGDAAYPPALLDTADPPLLLYVRGPAALLHGGGARPFAPARCLAIVGSRNPTAQGAEHARRFAQALRAQGLCIVSGLALGVDAAAHEGALAAAAGPGDADTAATIAVVGTGLDRVYPRAHHALARRIVQRGLLVSEYPLGTPPLPAHFPQRNRIISGLSQGTLVVEAALASGSLITARLAAEQGREVFAIPGSVHAPQSRGCHALIRDGAKLVESAQDVLEELRLPAAPAPQPPAGAAAASGADDPVLDALGHDPTGLDALTARTGLDAAHLQARLLELELDGQVARLPGGLFQRIGLG
ncbi:DNA protecting protein DprA [Oryzisolibacter propanilivorax]|uniref:DNA protecting protein DprA n=1 Tax=Oryzisolibacter propanilivorax TaxID=1527607 RepID=A0A1G9QKW5_9BURK|nr:DNA-processing protein DprA [Oryzisolibacter propanilivorax]SDM11664.1 DNA protecting protein DprA [Oryzisolibacter propanilivorax]